MKLLQTVSTKPVIATALRLYRVSVADRHRGVRCLPWHHGVSEHSNLGHTALLFTLEEGTPVEGMRELWWTPKPLWLWCEKINIYEHFCQGSTFHFLYLLLLILFHKVPYFYYSYFKIPSLNKCTSWVPNKDKLNPLKCVSHSPTQLPLWMGVRTFVANPSIRPQPLVLLLSHWKKWKRGKCLSSAE